MNGFAEAYDNKAGSHLSDALPTGKYYGGRVAGGRV